VSLPRGRRRCSRGRRKDRRHDCPGRTYARASSCVIFAEEVPNNVQESRLPVRSRADKQERAVSQHPLTTREPTGEAVAVNFAEWWRWWRTFRRTSFYRDTQRFLPLVLQFNATFVFSPPPPPPFSETAAAPLRLWISVCKIVGMLAVVAEGGQLSRCWSSLRSCPGSGHSSVNSTLWKPRTCAVSIRRLLLYPAPWFLSC